MRIEIFGGPMDGDMLPDGYIPRAQLNVISTLVEEGTGRLLAHVYVLETENEANKAYTKQRYVWQGLQYREGLTSLVPLRIGQRLS